MQALRMSENPEALRLADEPERRLLDVKDQRDALLEAQKAAEPYLRHADVDYNVYVQCRAAIKAVEEGK